MTLVSDDFVFFWKPEQPHGWASQWYSSPFSAPIAFPDGEQLDVVFPTAEHWMMGQKALLFGDKDIFRRIVGLPSASASASAPPRPQANAKAGDTVRAPDPKVVKALGRKVKDFDEETWVRERARIVLEGSLLKFRQHAALRAELLQTGECELVEASPLDRIWGIGLGAAKAAQTCASEESRAAAGWGLNLLGKALMETRRVLRQEAEGPEVAQDAA
ncbi:hypothetical protein C8Q80DRAFT_1186847 [Daedaleopsis nitida]|nr:hypothetical protein C8Q80DRAFT_1186847 [Daedaleopsis nitida]